MTVIADTLKAKKRLVEAGFSDEKAEGIVAIFQSADAEIATKLDLELFRKDVNSRIDGLKKDVNSRIDGLGKDTKTEISGLKRDIEELRKETKTESDLLRRDLTNLILKAQIAGVASTVAILSAIKYFV